MHLEVKTDVPLLEQELTKILKKRSSFIPHPPKKGAKAVSV